MHYTKDLCMYACRFHLGFFASFAHVVIMLVTKTALHSLHTQISAVLVVGLIVSSGGVGAGLVII